MRFRLLYILGLLVAVFIGFLVGRIQAAQRCIPETKNAIPYNMLLGILRNEICEFDYSLDDKPMSELTLKLGDFPSGMQLTEEKSFMPDSVTKNYSDPKSAADLFQNTQRLDTYWSSYFTGELVDWSVIGADVVVNQVTHTRTPSQAHILFDGMTKERFEYNGEDIPSSVIIIPLKNVDESKSYIVSSYTCDFSDGSKGKCTDISVFYRNNNLIGRMHFSGNSLHIDLPKITEWAQKAADRMGR
jgi:hypothetical protein